MKGVHKKSRKHQEKEIYHKQHDKVDIRETSSEGRQVPQRGKKDQFRKLVSGLFTG